MPNMSDWSISSGSDSEGAPSVVRKRRERDLPESPFKLFCQHNVADCIIDPSSDADSLSIDNLQKRWDLLSSADKEHWEAKFGRMAADYLREHHLNGLSSLSLATGRGAAKGPSSTVELANETTRASGRKSPFMTHRAELHQVHNKRRYGRAQELLVTKHVATIEHDSIMKMTIKSQQDQELESNSQPAFEVTTFLSQLPGKGRDNAVLADLDMTEPIRYRDDRPITARAEAGEVITVKSKTIIETVKSIARGYPELSFQGDALVVPEPFCVFLKYRDQMLTTRDELHAGTSSAETSSNEAGTAEGLAQKAAHITMLYDFVDMRYLGAVEEEKTRWNKPVPTCTFEWSWLLFTPGTLVYQRTADESALPRAYLVEEFALGGLFRYDPHQEKPKVKPQWLDARQWQSYKNRLQRIQVTLLTLANDGQKWYPKRKTVSIMPFDGERAIHELEVYPQDFSQDSDGQIRNRLIARGKKYHMLSVRGLYQYQGQTLSGSRRWLNGRILVDNDTICHDPELANGWDHDRRDGRPIPVHIYSSDSGSSESEMKPSRRKMRNRIRGRGRRHEKVSPDPELDDGKVISITDLITVNTISGQSNNKTNLERLTELSRQTLKLCLEENGLQGDVDDEKLYSICDSKLNAYVLEERAWVLLSVDGISDCQFNTEMIHELQIDKDTKRIIQALANNYTVTPNLGHGTDTVQIAKPAAPWSSDFVPNKGRGQILLLHGKPGVGKTSAAECVADRSKRPLLSITCGDLGSESTAVQRELSRWLRLGALWNAVLLFDEADIFLEARTQGSDTKHNSLVSVFLRALEYYQGLIFLTTNRVGTFDEAVVSRIHVILHFPDLTNDDRQRIWDTSFKRLKDERKDILVDDSVRDQALRDPLIQSLNWNGREIRSAFNNMISLAEWDAQETGRRGSDGRVEVRREHLQQVATTSRGFKEYLKSLYGVGEAGRAKAKGLRDDEFGDGSK